MKTYTEEEFTVAIRDAYLTGYDKGREEGCESTYEYVGY